MVIVANADDIDDVVMVIHDYGITKFIADSMEAYAADRMIELTWIEKD